MGRSRDGFGMTGAMGSQAELEIVNLGRIALQLRAMTVADPLVTPISMVVTSGVSYSNVLLQKHP